MRQGGLGMRLGYKPKSVPCVAVLCLALPVIFGSLVGVVTVVGRWSREGWTLVEGEGVVLERNGELAEARVDLGLAADCRVLPLDLSSCSVCAAERGEQE